MVVHEVGSLYKGYFMEGQRTASALGGRGGYGEAPHKTKRFWGLGF